LTGTVIIIIIIIKNDNQIIHPITQQMDLSFAFDVNVPQQIIK